MSNPVAIRYDFDGYGYKYMDSGSGSDWQTRVNGEPLYTHPANESFDRTASHMAGEYVSYPAKTLTDEDIARVVHELNQKANTPERWVTAMQIGAETIIQLRDELRKEQEK
jgi:hypothetical protein